MLVAPPALHVANLTGLTWLRKECRANLQRAAHLFAMDEATAAFYGALPDATLEAMCAELDLSLLIPRYDGRRLREAVATARTNGSGRHRPDLAARNLAQLQAVREASERSMGDAVWIYRISQETATAFRELAHDDAIALAKALDLSVLVPRYAAGEARRILDRPPGARALFAAAYETEIAASAEAVQRCHFLTH
jgi:hypothetical protein